MKKHIRVLILLYFAGFAAGIFCSNLLVKKAGYQTSLLPVYLLASAEKQGSYDWLFPELLLKRGKIFAAGILCGLTPAGVPAVTACMLWYGFLAGSLITVFLLEYGIKGMALSAACFLPQAFFYIPGWLFLFFIVMQMSQKYWGKGKREKADYKAYFFFASGAGAVLLLGVWMESYVNQNLLQYILSKWI